MSKAKVYRAIGLMSGTSADGVDAALIETDGQAFVKPVDFFTIPYDERVRSKIRACFGLRERSADVAEAERLLTFAHVRAVTELLAKRGEDPRTVDIVGFHGQTLMHDPAHRFTWQIGDGGTLARQVGIDVINDFRSKDMQAGGQGAPFLPLYHEARVSAERLVEISGGPVAVLNIGGVSNVTYIDEKQGSLIAFDTGPGNALMDDYVFTRIGAAYDEDGKVAASGTPDMRLVESWTALPYFARPAPKSLDRNEWDITAVEYLPPADALATLAEFTVESIGIAESLLPERPALWMVTGGGRKNAHLMRRLGQRLSGAVRLIDHYGWNGDCVEAEGFAYLAVRSLLGLPLSLPMTTGVPAPMTGGVLNKAARKASS